MPSTPASFPRRRESSIGSLLIWFSATFFFMFTLFPPLMAQHHYRLAQDPFALATEKLNHLQAALHWQSHDLDYHKAWMAEARAQLERSLDPTEKTNLQNGLSQETERAARQNPWDVNATYELMQVHLNRWLQQPGVTEANQIRILLKRVTDMDPYNPFVCERVGIVYQALGDTAQAEYFLDKAIALKPEDPQLKNSRAARFRSQATGLFHQQDYEGAYQRYQKAAVLSADPAGDLQNAAACRVNQRRYADARQILIDLLAKQPGYGPALELKAKLDRVLK